MAIYNYVTFGWIGGELYEILSLSYVLIQSAYGHALTVSFRGGVRSGPTNQIPYINTNLLPICQNVKYLKKKSWQGWQIHENTFSTILML